MKFKAGWKFLTQWKGFQMSQATWEPLSTFIIPSPSCSVVHPAFKDFSKGKPHLFQLSERFCRRQASPVVEHLSETTPVQVDWTPRSGKPASESPKEEGIYWQKKPLPLGFLFWERALALGATSLRLCRSFLPNYPFVLSFLSHSSSSLIFLPWYGIHIKDFVCFFVRFAFLASNPKMGGGL